MPRVQVLSGVEEHWHEVMVSAPQLNIRSCRGGESVPGPMQRGSASVVSSPSIRTQNAEGGRARIGLPARAG